jgi:hypothetical protein
MCRNEDPVISMARRTLYYNNSPRWNNGHVMTFCYYCKKHIMTRGSRQIFISGKKRYVCQMCYKRKHEHL